METPERAPNRNDDPEEREAAPTHAWLNCLDETICDVILCLVTQVLGKDIAVG